MFKTRRKLLSQNFLHNRRLVHSLVGRSFIGKKDLVLEIGPGKGIITEALLAKAEQIIAVEIDPHWSELTRKKFIHTKNLILYQQDFLSFKLPRLPYKVFANIPFAIEGKIIRKLIEDDNPPTDCYLVIMKELAIRLEARHKDNMFSVMHKPWFDFSISHHFNKYDFSPPPNVNAVLFRFAQKSQPLLSWKERKKYQLFVERAYQNGVPIRQNLKKFYNIQKLDSALQAVSLKKAIKPGNITLKQWIALYMSLHF